MPKLPKAVDAALSALTIAKLVEPLSTERALACGFHELGARATNERVFLHAHGNDLDVDTLERITRCTTKPGARCPHAALLVDYELQADINDDAGTFTKLRALLAEAGIALKVVCEIDDDVVVRVSQGAWSVAASIDVDESVAVLASLLNTGCEQVGTDRRFVHVFTKKLSTHAIVLRTPAEREAMRGVFRSG